MDTGAATMSFQQVVRALSFIESSMLGRHCDARVHERMRMLLQETEPKIGATTVCCIEGWS